MMPVESQLPILGYSNNHYEPNGDMTSEFDGKYFVIFLFTFNKSQMIYR